MRVHPILVLVFFSAATLAAESEGFLETEPGVRLHWRAAGMGEETLIVPGGFLFGTDFDVLAAGRRVIFYDMRNRGRSSRITDPALLTIEADVRDLEAIRRHFEIDRFSTIGYSYLGKMVVLYAIAHPERVERIVQIGPVSMRFGSLIPPTQDNSREQVLDPDALAEVRKLREKGLHESSPAEYCEEEWRVTRVRLVGDPQKAARLAWRCDLENEWPTRLAFHLQHHFVSAQKSVVTAIDVAALHVPVLTVHGTKDRNASYGGGREWAALLPHARLLTVEGAAHQVWFDDPAVVGAIATFLGGEWPEHSEDLAIATEDWLSRMRAWELLTEARARLGAAANRSALRLLWRGALFPASQSRSAAPPFDSFPIQEEVLVDPASRAVSIDETLEWPNFTSRHRIVAGGGAAVEIDRGTGRAASAGESAAEIWFRQIRRVPSLLLDDALDDPQEARYLGVRRFDRGLQHLVAIEASGVEATLRLDRDLRLRGVSRLLSDPLLGDVLEEMELDGDRVVVWRNGALVADLGLESVEAIDPESAAAKVSRPDSAEVVPESAGQPPALEALAPSVWLMTRIGGGDYTSLVVEKGDELLLVETPVSADAMRPALALLRERFPDKPLRTVLMTHHHFDHSGGVIEALRSGAAIVTTPGNEAFVRAVAAAPRTLERSAAPVAGRPEIRLVRRDPLVLAGAGPVVEVHRLDGNGHADEMLFVWLPKERILFQGDLFVLRDEPEPARPQALALARVIDERGLDVQRLVGVHGRIATLEDLRESVRRAAR